MICHLLIRQKNRLFSVAVAATLLAIFTPTAWAAPQASSNSTTTYHRMQIDGVGVFYREAGPKDAPTIVLLHGFPTSSRQYEALIPLLAFAFGWAENMVQAAIKSVPLGQTAGQRILARLMAEIPAAVDLATDLSESDRQAFMPMLAILSARHETQYSRLFRS
jgi:urease accessory protein UreF